jgi:hypothetical protein
VVPQLDGGVGGGDRVWVGLAHGWG